jgi:hypothetical protein
MEDNKIYFISDDLLRNYIHGEATVPQTMYVAEALMADAGVRERHLAFLREEELADRRGREIPLERAAAASQDNLCDLQCEAYILQHFVQSDEVGRKLSETGANRWLKQEGTPLHNMGRILEKGGMTVTRRYDCTKEDLEKALAQRIRLIAVVDNGALRTGQADGVFHAVVVTALNDYLIKLYDPAEDSVVEYPTSEFMVAWACSRHYLVSATTDKLTYDPHPMDLSDVELDEDLLELTEIIAENTHEIWGLARKEEGIGWGPVNDATHNKDMVPYCDLPESEKDYDRNTAMMALKLAKKLGFRVSRYGDKACPHCGGTVSLDMRYCPQCGRKLEWEDFF